MCTPDTALICVPQNEHPHRHTGGGTGVYPESKRGTGDSLEEAGSQVYVVVDGFFSFRGKPRPQDLLPNFSSGVLVESAS